MASDEASTLQREDATTEKAGPSSPGPESRHPSDSVLLGQEDRGKRPIPLGYDVVLRAGPVAVHRQ